MQSKSRSFDNRSSLSSHFWMVSETNYVIINLLIIQARLLDCSVRLLDYGSPAARLAVVTPVCAAWCWWPALVLTAFTAPASAFGLSTPEILAPSPLAAAAAVFFLS